jgi:hypothetical protein
LCYIFFKEVNWDLKFYIYDYYDAIRIHKYKNKYIRFSFLSGGSCSFCLYRLVTYITFTGKSIVLRFFDIWNRLTCSSLFCILLSITVTKRIFRLMLSNGSSYFLFYSNHWFISINSIK